MPLDIQLFVIGLNYSQMLNIQLSNNRVKRSTYVMNLRDLSKLIDSKKIDSKEVIDLNYLRSIGVINSRKYSHLKFIGSDSLTNSVNLKANKFTSGCLKSVKAAKGSVEEIS